MRILEVLRAHGAALALAMLVGFLLALPPLIAKVRYGISFSSPVNIRVDDESFYFARIREVIDGHPTIGNAYLREHKGNPPAPVFLGEWLLAQPLQLVGANVVAGGVFYDFFFPALITILTYACLLLITRRRWLALLGSVFLLLGLRPADFTRAVSPQFNFIFWLSLFLLVYCATVSGERLRGRRWAVFLAAVNFGLLLYLYAYYWTFYLAFFAVFSVFLFARGHWAEVKAITAIVAGGFVLAVPYLFIIARALALPEYAETLRRIGMISSHFPSGLAILIPAIGMLGIMVVCFRLGFIAGDRPAMFFAAGILAAVASVNQHVITGKNLEFSSHYWLLAMFWFAFAAAYLLDQFLAHAPRYRTALVVAIAAVVVLASTANFAGAGSWFLPPRPAALASQRYLPVLVWVDSHVPADAVILAPDELSELIPIYTSANVYFATPARLFFLPDAELLDRFIVNNYYAEPFDAKFIARHMRAIYGVYYIDQAAHASRANWVRATLGLRPYPVEPVPGAALDRVLTRNRQLHALGFAQSLKRHRVDYLVWDRAELPNAPFGRISFLEPVHDEGNFHIYRIR